jgi:hypothetical protein
VQLRTGNLLRVPVLYVVLVMHVRAVQKHAVLSVSLSEWLGGTDKYFQQLS